MTLQQQLAMSSFIARNLNRKFAWGQWDCNLFFVELHDYVYGTRDRLRIIDKYDSAKTAFRFYRDFGVTGTQWMRLKGYEAILAHEVQEGDVALESTKLYAVPFVFHNGSFWTLVEGAQLAGYTTQAVAQAAVSYWRKI